MSREQMLIERARVEEQHARRFAKHVAIVRSLKHLPDPAHSPLVQEARAVVETWRERGLCSEYFWRPWVEALVDPVAGISVLLANRAAVKGLLQNSPFSVMRAVNPPHAVAADAA